MRRTAKRPKIKTLTEYCEADYILFRDLKPNSIDNLRHTLRQFVKWLGRDPRLDELNDELLSRWVVHLQATLAPKTAHGRRGDILGLWRDAFETDKTGKIQMPKRIRRVRVPDPEPESWTAEEVAKLIAAARSIEGFFRPEYRKWEIIERATYLEAIIRAAWETGLRRGDLLSLRWEQIGKDGTVAKSQVKTGILHAGQLSPETMALMTKLNRNPPLQWPDAPAPRSRGGRSAWGLGYWLARIRDLAGLGKRGALQKIRRSAATDVAIHQPGMETRFLGHTNPKADRFYIDKKRLPHAAVSPQALNVEALEAKGGAA